MYLFLATRFIVYTFLWFIVSMNYTFVCLRVLPGTPIYTDTHTQGYKHFFIAFTYCFEYPNQRANVVGHRNSNDYGNEEEKKIIEIRDGKKKEGEREGSNELKETTRAEKELS